MTAPALASCQNHPAREAVGLCVRCHASVCSECVTKVNGINHCGSCLRELATRDAVPKGRASSTAPPVLLVGYVVFLVLVVWGILEMVLPLLG